MNDISVKIEDTTKDLAVSPSTLSGAEQELDPLAIEEEKVPIKVPTIDVKTEIVEGSCDDDAKDKLNEVQTETETGDKLAVEKDIVKEEIKEEESLKETLEVTNNKPDNELPSTKSVDIPEVATELKETSIISEISKTPEVKEIPKLPEVKKEIPQLPEIKTEIPKLPEVSKEVSKLPDTNKETPKLPEPIKEVLKVPEIVKESEQKEKPREQTLVKEELEVKQPEKQTDIQTDVEMTEVVKVEDKIEKKIDEKPKQGMNGDVTKEDHGTKRRSSEEVETESPLKKLCQEVEKTFPQHDTMINDYIHTATKNNVDEIQRHTEQLLAEIQTLRELAQKKEHEWNNILHLKKVKEEILLRLLRRKQVLSFEKAPEVNGQDPFDYLNQAKNLAIDKSDEISGLSLKPPSSNVNQMMPTPNVNQLMQVNSPFNPMAGLPPPYDKAHLQSMPKPVFPQPMMMPGPLPGFPRDMNGQLPTSFGLPMGRQGPTKDVKSIIADYRQRNPEVAPRRGRRMKSILNPNMMNAPRPIAPKVDSLASLNNINMLFNNLDMNQKAMLERLQQIQAGGLPNGLSFKDVLVQFANMQQNNPALIPNRPMEIPRPDHHIRPDMRRRPERPHEDHKPQERLASPSPRLPPPPPYPEISLLPVSTNQDANAQQNSLLHGILTKQGPAAPQSFSPTLAKLLTSPERKGATLPTFGQAKNCGEITITPVQPTPPPAETQQEKPEEVVQLDDEESPASEGEVSVSPSGSGSGRLVIDETATGEGGEAGEAGGAGGGGEAEGEEETPLCQGCRRRDAQFVCAGCANQWYCSRDCQVAAWDEHSEMCSG